MTEVEFERLFWEEIDGPPQTERRERLEALSRQEPRLERLLADLESFHGRLQAVEELAPPPELRAEIRRQVASRPDHSRPAASLAAWLEAVFKVGWWPRLAYATLGAVVGGFLTVLLVGAPSQLSDSDRSLLSGALNVDGVGRASVRDLPLGGGAGSLRLSRRGVDLVVTVLPRPGHTLELELRRPGGGLEALGVEEIDGSRHELVSQRDLVRLVTDGPASLVLRVDAAGPQAIEVRVTEGGGATLLEQWLEPPPAAPGD